jgi:hypothetical protein
MEQYYKLKPSINASCTAEEIVVLTEGKILSVWAGDYQVEQISKAEAYSSVTKYRKRVDAREFPY